MMNKTMMQPATPKSRQSEPTSSDETMERISLHCHENSPTLSQLSCVNCQSLNIECKPRRNSKGFYVGCQNCLHSRELSSNCTLAHSDDIFITYRRIFQERIPATDDHDARHVCCNHEDPPMFNAFHPAPLVPIERTSCEVSVDERSLHKPSGPDCAWNQHSTVDERSLHKPSGPVENVFSPACPSQCRQCVIGNVPFYASPVKFTFQTRHKTSNGLVRGHRRMFYIPDPAKDPNTFHAFDIKNKRVKYIPKCRKQVFLECTTFPFHSLSNEARGCLVMFRSHGLKHWKLGIIRAMVYGVELINGKKVNGVVRLYEWVGNVIPGICAGDRLDLFYSYYDITELTEGRLDGHQYKNRLVEREYHLGKDDDHFDMVFINKVMGEVEISDRPDTVNPIDGCVQHSSLGK